MHPRGASQPACSCSPSVHVGTKPVGGRALVPALLLARQPARRLVREVRQRGPVLGDAGALTGYLLGRGDAGHASATTRLVLERHGV